MEDAMKKIADVLAKLTLQQEQQQQNMQLFMQRQPNKSDIKGIHLQPYDEHHESFENYLQRMENYLELRNLKDDTDENDKNCVNILLNCMNPKIHQTLICLTAPESPRSKKYKDLVKLLKEHFCPVPSEVAEQHKFSLRTQHEGESITSFQTELKRLSTNCNFSCESCKKSTITTHLRSQFIRGLRDNEIRERLLREKSTSFSEIIQLALAIEASKLESREMRGQNQSAIHTVNRVKYPKKFKSRKYSNNKNSRETNHKQSGSSTIKGKCYRCGKTDHIANKCKEKYLKCTKCNRKGHIRSVCLSKEVSTQNQIREYSSTDESDEEVYQINKTNIGNHRDKGKFLLKVCINKKLCEMELDTGAAVSTMSAEMWEKLKLKIPLESTSARLKTYTGEMISPIGVCKVRITYENKTINGKLYIIKQQVSSILGRDWMKDLGLEIKMVNQVQNDYTEKECKVEINKLINDYEDIFSETIGTIPHYKCSFKLKAECKDQIFIRPRPVPYALKGKIEDELARLEKLGIIEKQITHLGEHQ